jgi:hypothetical protein
LVDALLVSSSVQVHIVFVYLKQLLVRDGTRMSIREVVLLVVLELVLTSPLAELLEEYEVQILVKPLLANDVS